MSRLHCVTGGCWVVVCGVALLLPAASLSAADPNTSDQHWSYRPLQRSPLPEILVPGHVRNGIDALILRRLKKEGLEPSPPADRATLIRRVNLDLIGLLPTPDEVAAFVSDDRPNAYERLVDRLLASPHYGERWARLWMDLCHYADIDGYLTDQLRPVAWRYRHWLVDALNADLPFDRFTIQQLAGDLLPGSSFDQKIATGFLRQTLSNREGGADLEEFCVLQVLDRTKMVGTIWLGLTVGCARCHDHKYDEITQREFYQIYAFLNNADEVNIDAPLPAERQPYFQKKPEYDRKRRALIEPIEKELVKLQRRWEQRMLRAYRHPGEDHRWDRSWELLGLVWGGGKGEGQLEGTEIVKLDPNKRTQRQRDDILDYFFGRASSIDSQRTKELKLAELRKQIEKLKAELPQVTRAPTMREAVNPRQPYIHVRGNFRDRGPAVHPDVPAILPPLSDGATRNRLGLARWLVAPHNPLTPRVTVNRMWQAFFGHGLVVTPEDFGTQGAEPSHPQLLDWLAVRFIDHGLSVKAVHRLIVTSATYRQSSKVRPEIERRDPNNVLLSRQSSLRVPAETVRDLALSVSGMLSTKMGGPSVRPPQHERVTMEAFGSNDWKVSEGQDRYRRGLYTFILRTSPFAQSATFDAPNPGEICTHRDRSNTPLQALTLLNDPVFFEAAEVLAARLLREHNGSDAERIDTAFRLCLSRPPQPRERERLIVYLRDEKSRLREQPNAAKRLLQHEDTANDPLEVVAWTSLSSVLLNLHEFITRD